MGQMVLIDEDKLAKVEICDFWFDKYYNHIKLIQETFYPDFIITDPISGYQYYEMFLDYLYRDLLEKKSQKKSCKFFKRGH